MFEIGQEVIAKFLEYEFESVILDRINCENYLILVPNSFSDLYCVWDQFPAGTASCIKQQHKLAYFHVGRLEPV